MHTVYVLKSLIDGEFYVGCTSDISNRLEYHNRGRVKSTKHRRPFVLVYQEDYDSKYKAFEIEKYYKTAKGKKDLKNKMASSSNG